MRCIHWFQFSDSVYFIVFLSSLILVKQCQHKTFRTKSISHAENTSIWTANKSCWVSCRRNTDLDQWCNSCHTTEPNSCSLEAPSMAKRRENDEHWQWKCKSLQHRLLCMALQIKWKFANVWWSTGTIKIQRHDSKILHTPIVAEASTIQALATMIQNAWHLPQSEASDVTIAGVGTRQSIRHHATSGHTIDTLCQWCGQTLHDVATLKPVMQKAKNWYSASIPEPVHIIRAWILHNISQLPSPLWDIADIDSKVWRGTRERKCSDWSSDVGKVSQLAWCWLMLILSSGCWFRNNESERATTMNYTWTISCVPIAI